MSKRFVRDEILLSKLPVFINSYKDGGVTEEDLDKLVDLIEENLILAKAEEIKKRRQEAALNEVVAEAERLKLYDPIQNIEDAVKEVETWPEWKVKNSKLAFSEDEE